MQDGSCWRLWLLGLGWSIAAVLAVVGFCAVVPVPTAAGATVATVPADAEALWTSVEGVVLTEGELAPGTMRRRAVRVTDEALRGVLSRGTGGWLAVELFDGEQVMVRGERVIPNRSGSVSWIGTVVGDGVERGTVVLVYREGVTVGSLRVEGRLFSLRFLGEAGSRNSEVAGGTESGVGAVHVLEAIDETHSVFREQPPTVPELPSPSGAETAALAAVGATASVLDTVRGESGEPVTVGSAGGPDVYFHDLMVVYLPSARDGAGGAVALENLIDLGVTETNLSYERSGVTHRIFLAHMQLIDYDENQPGQGDLRDRLQNPSDGQMDEVHPLRDFHGADLVKLIFDSGGCGRAFIMEEVSPDFEAFAFCITSQRCISPGYTFQHELGHVQGGRHQWGADDTNNSPYTFNHGYLDLDNEFRTIMGVPISECTSCPRRLLWSNPDLTDPSSGAPLGVPEGEPEASDMRQTLNLSGPTVAGFRPSVYFVFANGFETGGLGGWSEVVGAAP